MTDSLFDTQAYNYPMLDDDTRIKIAKLRQSIARLEANLLTPDSVAKNANTDHNFNNNPILEQSSVDYAGELNQSQLLAATTIKGILRSINSNWIRLDWKEVRLSTAKSL